MWEERKSLSLLINKGIKEGKVILMWLRKIIRKSTKLNPASSHTDEVSSLDGKLTSKMASTSNMLSKSNTVNKERNKISKCTRAVSKKDNMKKSAKPKPASSKTYEFSYSGGKYIVPEVSDNVDDIDSDEEDQD